MSTDSIPSSPPPPPPPHETRRDLIRPLIAPVIGAILIVVGLGLLAQYMGLIIPERWSGLLLLIPAAGFLAAANTRYQRIGKTVDGNVVGLWFGTAVFVGLFLMVFFDLDDKLYGPLILIGIGGGILARHYWPRGDR